MNILTFDVEEYFQVENFKEVIDYDSWDSFDSRVEAQIDRILGLLDETNTKATFFTLGWIAERHPDMIRKIAQEGHEIGSHGYGHTRIMQQTPDEFRDDLKKSLDIIGAIIQKQVVSFRAPCFSVTNATEWALDILMEFGIELDSSIFPIVHDRYGFTGVNRLPHCIREKNGKKLYEFPITTCWYNMPFSGGGYFRLLPYYLIERCSKAAIKNGRPVIIYLHPWEFDSAQPRIRQGSRLAHFRHYSNLSSTYNKLKKLLLKFDFTSLKNYPKL